MSAERERPPPPPPPLYGLGRPISCSHTSLSPVDHRFISIVHTPKSMEDEFLAARERIWELENIEGPVHFSFYRQIQPLLQEGPTCGLVALSMASSCTQQSIAVQELLTEAQSMGFTNQGEMFSVDNMASLARKMLGENCREVEVLHTGLADKDYIIEMIATGSILLVPYDADANHAPCLRRGHKAHWAVVSGVVRGPSSCHLVARQGKSRHLGLWGYDQLRRSNENLHELDPHRDGRDYVVPASGVSQGLAGRAILLHSPGLAENPRDSPSPVFA